jgi:hypothetical protein
MVIFSAFFKNQQGKTGEMAVFEMALTLWSPTK